MTNNEALLIADNYEIILSMTGVDLSYSLELLDEVRKTLPLKDKLTSISEITRKKIDTAKTAQQVSETEIEGIMAEGEASYAAYLAQEFNGTFQPIDLTRLPTAAEHLDRRINKDGLSIARSAILFLSLKNLLKK